MSFRHLSAENPANIETYRASRTLTDRERDVFDTGDGIIPCKSVAGFAVHFHHSSYYHREGAGCCHVRHSCWELCACIWRKPTWTKISFVTYYSFVKKILKKGPRLEGSVVELDRRVVEILLWCSFGGKHLLQLIRLNWFWLLLNIFSLIGTFPSTLCLIILGYSSAT